MLKAVLQVLCELRRGVIAREDVDRHSGHCDNDGNELASSVAQWFSRFNDIEARARVSRHRDDIYSSDYYIILALDHVFRRGGLSLIHILTQAVTAQRRTHNASWHRGVGDTNTTRNTNMAAAIGCHKRRSRTSPLLSLIADTLTVRTHTAMPARDTSATVL